MNLKLKRLVRTPSSEQYALFDLDQQDADDQPLTIGKLDLHYTGEGLYGTLLLWDESARQLRPRTRRDFVHALLREVAQPMGVPNEYVVEFFAPSLDQYEVFHNVALEADEDESAVTGPSAQVAPSPARDPTASPSAVAPSPAAGPSAASQARPLP